MTQPDLLPSRRSYNFPQRLSRLSDGESLMVESNRERTAAIMFATRHNFALATQKIDGLGFKITRIIIGQPRDYFDGLDEDSQ